MGRSGRQLLVLLLLLAIAPPLVAQEGDSSSRSKDELDSLTEALDSLTREWSPGALPPEEPTVENKPDSSAAMSKEARDSAALAALSFDSSSVTLRSLPEGGLQSYLDDDEFNYHREYRDPETVWDRFMQWLRDLFSGMVPSGVQGTIWEFVFEVLPYIVMIGAIVFVVLKLTQTNLRGLFAKQSDKVVGDFTQIDENIHEMNFNTLIDEAIVAGHYRRAVRLLYLKSLKELSDRGLIDFSREKMNHDYLRELERSPLREPFADATLLFEYIWYGDMPVTASSFPRVREAFAGLNSQLQGRR